MPWTLTPTTPGSDIGMAPREPFAPKPVIGRYVRWQISGSDVGDDRAAVVDLVGTGVRVTRGVGANGHVLTVGFVAPADPVLDVLVPAGLQWWVTASWGGYGARTSTLTARPAVESLLFDMTDSYVGGVPEWVFSLGPLISTAPQQALYSLIITAPDSASIENQTLLIQQFPI